VEYLRDEVEKMRISGLNSGMDIDQIVSDLVKAQRIPMDRVFQQKVKAEWKRDAYRDVNTKLSRFRNLAFDLTLAGRVSKENRLVVPYRSAHCQRLRRSG
jgi:flagellar hook-associated protein 2